MERNLLESQNLIFGLKESTKTIKVNWEKDNEEGESYIESEMVEVPSDIPEDELPDWLSDKYGFLVSSLG